MKRISSRFTYFFKRVFPLLWVGFLIYLVYLGVVSILNEKRVPVAFFLMPVTIAAFGLFLVRYLFISLVDEVLDAGDALIVRNRNTEDRVALANIINISHSASTNPPRITLTLREPCQFSKEVIFLSPQQFFIFTAPPLVTELIERIDQARTETLARKT